MNEIFRAVLELHVALGSVALVLFWVALLQRKGGARHKRVGRVYVGTMYATLATAAVVVALGLADPLATHPPKALLEEAALARYAAEVRGFQHFLGSIVALTFGLLFFGDRAIRGPRARGRRLPLGDLAVGLLMVALSVYRIGGFGDQGVGPRSGIGLLVVGVGSILAACKRPSRMGRLRDHMIGVLGSAVAAHTAFFVSLVPRLSPGLYERDPSVQALPWVLPVVVGWTGIACALWYWGRESAAHPIAGSDAASSA